MRAAIFALREQTPAYLLVAVPVAAPEVCANLKQYADEIICAFKPESLVSVGYWYEDFSQVSDDDVRQFLHQAHQLVIKNTSKSEG
jgi:predicted phosphoribosyltransferase